MTRRSAMGWRSLRSSVYAENAPPLLAPTSGGAGIATPSVAATRVDEAPAAAKTLRGEIRQLLRGVEWTPTYIGFLLYMFVITTFRLPLATPAILLALGGLLFQRGRMRFPPMLVWLVAFVMWSVLGYSQTYFPEASWKSLELLIKVAVVTFVAANALRSRAQVHFFMIFYLACFALYPMRGAMFNYYFYSETLRGRAIWLHSYDNPNDLAALCLLMISLALSLLVTEHAKWTRRAVVLGMALLPLLVLMTQSRGAIIALAAMLLLLVAKHGRELKAMIPKRRRGQVLAVGAVLAMVVLANAPDAVWSRLSRLSNVTDTQRLEQVDPEGSAKQRFEIWRVAMYLSARNPLIGVGVGAYPYEHERFSETEGMFERTSWGRRDPHSTYIRVMAETGIPGLVLFVGIVLSAVIPSNRIRKRAKRDYPRESLQILMLEIGLLGYFLAGVFGSFAYLPFIYIHLLLMVVLATMLRERMKQDQRVHRAPMPAAAVVAE